MSNYLDSHCKMRVPIPVGLPELISDIARQVLQNKPTVLIPYIADYVESKLMAREASKNVSNYIDNVFYDVRSKLLMGYKKRGISEEAAEEAASKIQALYKGHKVRQVLHEMSHKKISMTSEVNTEQQRKSKSQQRSFHPSEDAQSIQYLKVSETSVAESTVYPLSSKLHIQIDDDNQSSRWSKYGSLESVKSEFIPPTKATVLTDLQQVTNDSQEEIKLQEYNSEDLIKIKIDE